MSTEIRAIRSIERALMKLTPKSRAHILRMMLDKHVHDAPEPPDRIEAERRRSLARRRGHDHGPRPPVTTAGHDRADDAVSTAVASHASRSSKTPGVPEFLKLYVELFEEKYQEKPHIVRGRDHGLVRAILSERGWDKAAELLRKFFASTDPFIVKSGHGIGVFSSVQNKLIAEGIGSVLTAKTAGNAAAARAFVEEMQGDRGR